MYFLIFYGYQISTAPYMATPQAIEVQTASNAATH